MSVLATGPRVDPRIGAVARRLQCRVDDLPDERAYRRSFLETYLRTTIAVGQAVAAGTFEDPDWVSSWDTVFVNLFLAAHDAELSGDVVPRPWRLAFATDPAAPPLLHVLVELNAHLNWDLPQALLTVLSDEDLCSPELLASRRRDHGRIDDLLAGRIAAEGRKLDGRLRTQAAIPLRAVLTRRFLPRARDQAWHNVLALADARRTSPAFHRQRLADLDALASAKTAELRSSRWALLRVGVVGFGVTLPPA